MLYSTVKSITVQPVMKLHGKFAEQAIAKNQDTGNFLEYSEHNKQSERYPVVFLQDE